MADPVLKSDLGKTVAESPTVSRTDNARLIADGLKAAGVEAAGSTMLGSVALVQFKQDHGSTTDGSLASRSQRVARMLATLSDLSTAELAQLEKTLQADAAFGPSFKLKDYVASQIDSLKGMPKGLGIAAKFTEANDLIFADAGDRTVVERAQARSVINDAIDEFEFKVINTFRGPMGQFVYVDPVAGPPVAPPVGPTGSAPAPTPGPGPTASGPTGSGPTGAGPTGPSATGATGPAVPAPTVAELQKKVDELQTKLDDAMRSASTDATTIKGLEDKLKAAQDSLQAAKDANTAKDSTITDLRAQLDEARKAAEKAKSELQKFKDDQAEKDRLARDIAEAKAAEQKAKDEQAELKRKALEDKVEGLEKALEAEKEKAAQAKAEAEQKAAEEKLAHEKAMEAEKAKHAAEVEALKQQHAQEMAALEARRAAEQAERERLEHKVEVMKTLHGRGAEGAMLDLIEGADPALYEQAKTDPKGAFERLEKMRKEYGISADDGNWRQAVGRMLQGHWSEIDGMDLRHDASAILKLKEFATLVERNYEKPRVKAERLGITDITDAIQQKGDKVKESDAKPVAPAVTPRPVRRVGHANPQQEVDDIIATRPVNAVDMYNRLENLRVELGYSERDPRFQKMIGKALQKNYEYLKDQRGEEGYQVHDFVTILEDQFGKDRGIKTPGGGIRVTDIWDALQRETPERPGQRGRATAA